MQKNAVKKKRSWWKWVLWILLILLILIGIAVAIVINRADKFLSSTDVKIINDPAYFQNGHAQLQNVNIDFSESILHPKLTLHDVKIIDSTAYGVQMDPALTIDEVYADVSLFELLKKKIYFNNLTIRGAHVKVYKDEKIAYDPSSIFVTKPTDTTKEKSALEIDFTNLEIKLIDLSLDYIDKIKGKDIQGTADSLVLFIDIDEDTTAHGYLNLDIKHLTFNTAKGGYLTNSRVQGPLEITFADQLLKILPTTLNISGDDYMAYADLYFDKKSMTVLHIEKKDLIVSRARPLLTRKIQEGIAPFDVDGPIHAKADIEFYPGDKNPRAIVDMYMPNNVLHVGNLVFDQGFLKARFINRLNDDYADFFGEDKQNLRLFVDKLDAKFHDLNVNVEGGVIGFGPAVGTWVELDADIGGKAFYVSDFLGATDFRLQNGLFSSKLQVHGDVNNMDEVIAAISGQILFSDIALKYNPENILIPINRIGLDKNKNTANFHLRTSKTVDGDDLEIEGIVTHINDVLTGHMNGQTHARAKLKSERISWDGFTGLILPITKIGSSNPKPKKSSAQSIGALKTLLSSLYDNFYPRIELDIDKFIYSPDKVIDDFKSNLSFGNRYTVLLSDTRFNFDEARVATDLSLDIKQKDFTYFDIALNTANVNSRRIVEQFGLGSLPILENTEYLPERFELKFDVNGNIEDAAGIMPSSLEGEVAIATDPLHPFELGLKFSTQDASAENPELKTSVFIKGAPEFVNPYLKSMNINFIEGLYELSFDYNDQVTTLKDAIVKTHLNFDINNTYLEYLPNNFRVPIQYFSLETEKNNGTFDLMLYSDSFDQRLNLEGNLQNMVALMYNQIGDSAQVTTDINAYSPRIDWNAYQYLFTGLKNPNKKKPVEKSNENNFANVKAAIFNGFQSLKPNLDLNVDTFNFREGLVLRNVLSDVYMDIDSFVNLENGHFDLDSGSFNFAATLNLFEKNRTPFSADFSTENFDFAQLLKDLNYLNLKELQEIDSLNGIIDLDLTLSSEYDEDATTINQDSTEAIIRFTIHDLAATGIAVIDSLIDNSKWRNRLRNIYIDSISNTIVLKNNEIKLNLMEVQANAFQFFIEGAISSNPSRNIWVTIPLSNLKKHDQDYAPKQTGYANSGAKVFLEIIPTGSGIDTKFHLSKRKFFASFDDDQTYKEYKKAQRDIRRRSRKNKTAQ